MPTQELSQQVSDDEPAAMIIDADETTTKRAEWESFAFVIPTAGKVNVANHSHGEDQVREHTYTVTVDAGGPIECTCPAFEYHCSPGEACKHMVAVAETEPVRVAAVASVTQDDVDDEPELVTDGGHTLEEYASDDGEECDCAALPDDWPCFDCFLARDAELPEGDHGDD